MGCECKTSQDLKISEAIFNPRVVDKDMKGWRAKLRDACEIDAIPNVSMTIQHLYVDFSSMEEKAPIPSRYKSRQDTVRLKRGRMLKGVSRMKRNRMYFLEWGDHLT